MSRLLLFFVTFFFLSSYSSYSQQGFLFVKKGFHKKKIYTEGDEIRLRLEDGSYRIGIITLLRNDTIFINGEPVYRPLISSILLERRPAKPLPDAKTMLLIGAGSALAATGLILSHQAPPGKAVVAGLVIGYGPLLVKHFGSRFIRLFIRKKYRIGKKFHLQVLEFHLPPGRKAF